MAKKTYNEQLNDPAKKTQYFDLTKTMPQYVAKWGKTGVVASPLEYNAVMKIVPKGFIVTTDAIRKHLADKHKVDCVCPMTCGIFVNLCAKAAVERNDSDFPYWRTVRPNGELCDKFPHGTDGHKMLLEAEGHKVIQKGKKFFVENYEQSLFEIVGV
ncbi:MAG: hypothetical protein FWC94_02095 [Bacteroidales bacterium]|nr:hypothetical protein [Bacteroidales bacterium]